MEARKEFDKDYWNNRYQSNNTGWDIGYPSTPFIEYFNQIQNTSLKILIPGCGKGYEAEHLFKSGFKNVFILDFAEQPLYDFQQRVPFFPNENLINNNFFSHKDEYDIILEQTFFCALDPSLRKQYVNHCFEILKDNGSIIGLLFEGEMDQPEPPFKGTKREYIELFSNHFDIKTIQKCYNSIQPRQGNELFINFRKKCLKD